MNQMTEPSMYERPEKPDWPLNALPLSTVERILALMSATYGSRFASLWSGTDPTQMLKVWGVELAKLSDEQRKAGISSLTALTKAPTLPEFVAHCKQARMEAVASQAPKIENNPTITPEKAAEGIRAVQGSIKAVRRTQGTADWAFKILLSGRTSPYEVVRCASDAVTSQAGREAVENCDPAMRDQYRALRQKIVDDYRMRGKPLWGSKS